MGSVVDAIRALSWDQWIAIGKAIFNVLDIIV